MGKNLQDKDGYKIAPFPDREQERFDIHKCRTGRTQCTNSQRDLAFLTL